MDDNIAKLEAMKAAAREVGDSLDRMRSLAEEQAKASQAAAAKLDTFIRQWWEMLAEPEGGE